MLKVYGIKNCNTVKKSLDWLTNQNFKYEFYDIKKNILNKSLLDVWIKNLGNEYTWKSLINRTSLSWKQLGEEEKNTLSELDNAINAIIDKPTLMKRPVITEHEKVILIGFDENLYKKKLK